MKTPEKLSENTNYTAVDLGKLSDLSGYSLEHPKLKRTIEGKVFLKDVTNATGTQISFMTLPPEKSLDYFHTHQQNEETYIVLGGNGKFQVDNDCFDIREGSVVRVATNGKRSLCNTSPTDQLVYMVIQSKENSLEQHTTDDGARIEHPFMWEVK